MLATQNSHRPVLDSTIRTTFSTKTPNITNYETSLFCTPSNYAKLFQKQQKAKQENSFQEEVLMEGFNELSIEDRLRAFKDLQNATSTSGSRSIQVKQINNNNNNRTPIVMPTSSPEDIHDDPSNYINEQLALLHEEIHKIKGKKIRNAYDLAIKLDKEYVTNRKFRLKFLRTDEFNPQEAAKRIMKHFDIKLELFGGSKLCKDITFDDLSIEDQKSASAGSHQMYSKDIYGRTILFCFAELYYGLSWENFARGQWYNYMVAASEDESVQRDGIVIVTIGFPKGNQVAMGMKSQRMVIPALPFRPAAMHTCAINQNIPIFAKGILDLLGKKWKVRFHLHIEENVVTCLYKLQSYGINPAIVPLEHDGRPHMGLFLEYQEKRKMYEREQQKMKIEEDKKKNMIKKTNNNNKVTTTITTTTATTASQQQQKSLSSSSSLPSNNNNYNTNTNNDNDHCCNNNNDNDSIIIIPTNRDVLLGRGIKHHGNYMLDNLVDIEITTYKNSLTQFDKSCIVLKTVKRVQSLGGRFLMRTNYNWSLADDNIARETVSTRFRNKARKIKKISVRKF